MAGVEQQPLALLSLELQKPVPVSGFLFFSLRKLLP
jgi:hypothetical protein